ncbi:hypothetical protein CF95_gp095 [Erwinia phage PhiEaH1]|uniref:Uncharacterized protein n=1 Tax=Erwinia phage PhiEaH1 TaxID=1401669 RepID=W8CZE4_9CAUD|nr:hypothetical protein CF95_gp095 [Erwinia phage PhiEaH1]AGX01817.1 hypothetical protein [Erwinia phage PhiEaH1]
MQCTFPTDMVINNNGGDSVKHPVLIMVVFPFVRNELN